MLPTHALRRSRWTAAAAITVTSVLLATTACSAEQTDEPTTKDWELTADTPDPSGPIDSFTWVSYAEPWTLDYAHAFDYADNQVLANICESLLRLNPDFTLSPGLAKSYDHPDPKTWVYHLREGVTFHDGSPLTAADAVASMRRHLDPGVASAWFSVYQNVKSIEQTGKFEVTVKMRVPDSQFNLGMGGSAGVIESAKTLEAKGKNYGNSTVGVNCTGPFELAEWKSGERIILERYDNYWNEDLKAKTETVEFIFMGDPNARVNALKSGEVDGGWMIPWEAVPSLESSDAGEMYFGLTTAVSSLIVGDLKGPLGDPDVRKALLMAIDREGLVSAAAQGYADVTNALTTKSVWVDASDKTLSTAFDDLEKYPYDIEAAKKLIEKAGVEGEEIVIATAPISNDFSVISQATQAAAEAIGLQATIKTMTPNAYTTLFSDPNARKGVDLFYTSWYLSSPDPLEMYAVLRPGEFSNYGNWKNEEFTKIVNKAIGTDDAAARSKLTAQAQQIANEELPWLPLYQAPMPLFLSDRITGVAPSIGFLYYPWAATIGAS